MKITLGMLGSEDVTQLRRCYARAMAALVGLAVQLHGSDEDVVRIQVQEWLKYGCALLDESGGPDPSATVH